MEYIKKQWKLISGFVGVAVGAFTLGLQTSSATPSVGMDTVMISKNEVSAIFENKSDPSISDFNADIYLHYPEEIKHFSKENAGALMGRSGRRIIKFNDGVFKKAEKVTVCISFSGPYTVDTIWQKFELEASYTKPIAASHGIYSYYGGAIEVGHNYIFGSGCQVNS